MNIAKSMHPARLTFAVLVLVALAWVLPGQAQAGLKRAGVRVDSHSAGSIAFTVPVGTGSVQQTWIRIVTFPAITPVRFRIERTSGIPADSGDITPGGGTVYINPGGGPMAGVSCSANTPSVNVYSIKLDHLDQNNCADPYSSTDPQCQPRTIDPASPETWTLTIYNDSGKHAVFGVFIADTAAETEGPDVWLRDNAIEDPSGHHTLNNPANLDLSIAPTPNEWWKSPAIRFTDNSGNPTKNPVNGQPNNVYVKVRNFGTLPVSSVTVKVYWANASAGLPPFDRLAPDPRWNPLGAQTIAGPINPGEDAETTAFVWSNVPAVPAPGQQNHFCLFAFVENSAGPLDPVDFSSTVVDIITPTNTNATHRNVVILAAPDPVPTGSTPFFFAPVKFLITNPFKKEIYAEVSVKGLPIAARNSRILFTPREGDRIKLQGIEKLPPERKDGKTSAKGDEGVRFGIVDTEKISVSGLRLKPGEQREIELHFGLAEPPRKGVEATVDIVQTVEGKVIGGMTYVLSAEKPKEKVYGKRFWFLVGFVVLVIIIALARMARRKK